MLSVSWDYGTLDYNYCFNKRKTINFYFTSFRFRDEDDYEYQIFTILSIAHPLISVISAGKRDSRRHSITCVSENVVVAGTSYQK